MPQKTFFCASKNFFLGRVSISATPVTDSAGDLAIAHPSGPMKHSFNMAGCFCEVFPSRCAQKTFFRASNKFFHGQGLRFDTPFTLLGLLAGFLGLRCARVLKSVFSFLPDVPEAFTMLFDAYSTVYWCIPAYSNV